MNLDNLITLLGLSSYECHLKRWKGEKNEKPCIASVDYASSIIFELYEENESLFVDLIFNGRSI